MKNHLMIFYKILVVIVLSVITPKIFAQSNLDALADLTWIQMLNSVELGKTSDLIKKFQEREARNVLLKHYSEQKNGCQIENIRNKEVLLITIPASALFSPNSTELSESASKVLDPIKRYLRRPDMWRVMLVMHTDNTGSPEYRKQITEKRALAVTDWFEDQEGLDTSYLFPYALSDSQPLKECPNNNMENRAKNRRLEIYLVPGEKMVEEAKHGRISY